MERYDYISGHFCVLLVLLCCSVRLGSVCCLKRYSPLKENLVTSACIERALVSKKAWIVGSSSTLGRKELYNWILVHSFCTIWSSPTRICIVNGRKDDICVTTAEVPDIGSALVELLFSGVVSHFTCLNSVCVILWVGCGNGTAFFCRFEYL